MSKSPGSVASSDEAQSVSDESLAMSAATSHTSLRSVGVAKAVKKAKEEAKERPPWRPASITQSVAPVPPPPKPDLKARLLEASKRMRRVNAAVQTDPVHTKLMKEASNDEQSDLIVMVDEEILTDGNLALARDTGNLILTHSVAQMTDHAVRRDTGTQTAMPRSAVSFRKFLEPMEPMELTDPLESPNAVRPETAGDEMAAQIDEKIKRLLSPEDDKSSTASDSIKEPNTPDLISATVDGDPSPHKPHFLDTPTFAAWQNLDFSDEESDGYLARELPRRTVGEGDRPWADFKDLVIGKRVINMRLSPVPLRRRRPNKKTVTWSDEQHRAVSNLLTEASALVDMFDQVSMLLGPDIPLPDMPVTEEFKLPPSKWEPLLSKSCDLLEEKLAQVRHLSQENLDSILISLEPSVLDGGEA